MAPIEASCVMDKIIMLTEKLRDLKTFKSRSGIASLVCLQKKYATISDPIINDETPNESKPKLPIIVQPNSKKPNPKVEVTREIISSFTVLLSVKRSLGINTNTETKQSAEQTPIV